MIIAQITDLHVVARDRLCYGEIPTNAQVAEAVAHINSLAPQPDVVIASGDLVDHGREEEYEVLHEILAKLNRPVLVIPGNHDRREALLKAFADQRYLPRVGAPFIHYAIEDYPIRLVGLVMEPRAIQLHVLDPGYGLVSHLSYVPSGYRYIRMLDSLSEKDRSELVERTRRDCEELRRTEYDPMSAK